MANECELLVMVRWRDLELAVPLAQRQPVDYRRGHGDRGLALLGGAGV
jgi:hypothetical protein